MCVNFNIDILNPNKHKATVSVHFYNHYYVVIYIVIIMIINITISGSNCGEAGKT